MEFAQTPALASGISIKRLQCEATFFADAMVTEWTTSSPASFGRKLKERDTQVHR